MKWRTNILFSAVLLVTNFAPIEAIAVDCTYQILTYTGSVGTYTCVARALFDETENESVTAVFGIHQTGRGHGDVRGFHLRSQNLEFVPTNIEHFFPNIDVLDFTENNITSISNRHLIPFPNLQLLLVRHNEIASINGDLFSGLDSMTWSSFSDNNIRHVGHDLNLPINGLSNFSNNPCIDQVARTPDQVIDLKLNLLRNCPPTISQIEHSLENRINLLTHIVNQVQTLQNEQANQLARIVNLERITGNELVPAIQSLMNKLRKND